VSNSIQDEVVSVCESVKSRHVASYGSDRKWRSRFAAQIGVTPVTLDNWRKGKTSPSPAFLSSLREVAKTIFTCGIALLCLAPTHRPVRSPKGAQLWPDHETAAIVLDLPEPARPAGVKSATHGRVAGQQVPSLLPQMFTPRTSRALIVPPPTPRMSVYQWDIPAWLPYQFNRPSNGSRFFQPHTWLERVTVLGATNWTRCSSNVPITILTRSASVVVTNLPVYFLRPAYGWPKD